VLCSLLSDLIPVEVKCGECLWKRENEWINRRKRDVSRVTLFCCRALARYRAPCTPIPLLARSSVMSVCEEERMNG
jgi:hypothetical protein